MRNFLRITHHGLFIMHFDAFDRYHDKESFLHRLDPRVKVVVTIVFILSNALLPDGAWLAFLTAWLFLLLANHLSKLGLGYSLKRSIIAYRGFLFLNGTSSKERYRGVFQRFHPVQFQQISAH